MNLFHYPNAGDQELFDTLLQKDNIKVERIVSYGQVTPKQSPYIQQWDEFVLVLQGQARLKIAAQDEVVLQKGDFLHLPKQTPHWVTFTSSQPPVIWLAIHFRE
ncbi:cupin domain-containing protein [Facilibium subflavum]|uniref:cupin domain-containing protein n=1 Tax=Facilibium subflavum TaxID=2219058 RepID=UPI000E646D0E|nr:cupin domain-containing protein [Facilibium subflavum]